MAVDLSVLDEPKGKGVDLSVLDGGVDLSVLNETDDPSGGDMAKGLAAEVAIAEGLKYTGATAGAAAGPVGATVGYISGAIVGGVTGSLAAQKLEGRDEISWGRLVSDTVLNLLPGGLGKAQKGSKLLPRLAKGAAIRSAEGAVVGAGGMQMEKAIDEGELLTLDELTSVAAIGAGLNLGLGAAGELLKKSYPKFGGKGADFLNDAYEKGDHDAIAVTETLVGENPKGRGDRYFKMLKARIAPGSTLGRQVTEETNKSLAKAKAALDTASVARDQINKVTRNFTQEQKDSVDDYLFGRTKQLIPEAESLREIIDGSRRKIDEYQTTIIDLYDSGRIDLNEHVAEKIRKSIETKDYTTREYRFYEDSSYVPSAASESKLRKRLAKDGMNDEEIASFMQGLKDKRYKVNELMDHIAGASGGGKKILKKRKLDEQPELREYMGEYTETGERLFGTISRLGRLAAREEGNKKISEAIVSSKLGQVFDSPSQVPDGMVPLSIGGKAQTAGDKLVTRSRKKTTYKTADGQYFDTLHSAKKAGFKGDQLKKITRQATKVRQPGQTIYVTEDVNQALGEFFSSKANHDAPNFIADAVGKTLSTTTAGAKFVRVPLNLASYPVQWIGNAAMVAGQGMNPFSGVSTRKGAYRKGFGVALNEINNKGIAGGKYSIDEINRLKELDLVDQGVTASDIRDGFRNGIIPKAGSKAINFFGKAYNVFDTAQRIVVYENYKGFLKKHIPESQLSKMPKKDFEDLAAELTNSTYQNYGRINKNLRQLSRYGILNEFAAFNMELARTTYNQGRLAVKMINGSFADEMASRYGVTMDKAAMRKEGIKRMVALSSVLSAGSLGVTLMNRENGVDSDEENFIREFVAAPWERDQALHIRRDGNKLKLANMSYQIPSAEMTSVLEAALRGDDFSSAVGNSIESLWGKFGGDLTINLKNAMAAIQNRDLKTGRQISNARGLSKALDQVQYYFAENFTPGTVRDIKKFEERGGIGSIDNQLRYTLGYRSRDTDIETGIGFKMRDVFNNLQGVRSEYSSALYNSEDIAQAYESHNATYRQNTEILVDFVEKARAFHENNADAGLNDEKIASLMKNARIPKQVIEAAMQGRVADMDIYTAAGATKKEDKLRRYVDLGEKMSHDMLTKMLEQDFYSGKIKNKDIKRIMLTLEGRKAFP